MRTSVATSSKTYVIDFRPLFSALEKEVEDFYFYPKDVHGFIESCVLATQRETDLETRTNLILDEILSAMDLWADRESEHEALSLGTWINGKNMNRYLALNVLDKAIAIDTYVYNTMHMLYDVHDDLAISDQSFSWTAGNALLITISF